ncbi:MAG: 50S ribosomal protein L23 [Nitrospinota bacterium]|nr:50S ribosomal protein L23 [Nitrospinota bacterium]
MNGSEYFNIIKKPLLTEKATDLRDFNNKIAFEVDPRANKAMITEAIEKIFNVKVEKVNIINTASKPKRLGRYAGVRGGFKKAIVSLKEGKKIDIFERVI